ncbi:LPXTG cell wall anchor domain-containing protein [Kitasatospora misakiensis]|uniref:LPXTG cell wall anchor domain-containing protein n=1 Tax=Kitasatospora misakiensis TaxID=67330 RepID=A0ABW0X316_9ACTN
MRTSRLTTAAALLALTTAATVAGTTGAFAAATTGPSAAATTSPSAAATETPSAAATTPTATVSASATGTPSATPTLPDGCQYQRDVKMPVHTTASSITLTRDGASQDIAVSFQNTSSTTLTKFRIDYLVDGIKGLGLPKSLVKVQDGAWTAPALPPGAHTPISLGSFQVKPNEMITVTIRLTADATTINSQYDLSVTGNSEVLPWGAGPENVKYTCNRLTGSFKGPINVVNKAPATSTPSPSTTATPTTSASPSPSATRTATAPPAGTTGSTGSTGGHLAETGASSSTVPLAVTGGIAIALGAGAVLVARRRKAARG